MRKIIPTQKGIIRDGQAYELREAPDGKSPCKLCAFNSACEILSEDRGICTVLHNANGKQYYAKVRE